LVYILVISLTVGALLTWTMNALRDTGNFQSAQLLQDAASNTTELAIQNIRFTPLLTTTVGEINYCWGSGPTSQFSTTYTTKGVPDTITMVAWCETNWNPTSQVSRTVDIWTCVPGVTGPSCEQTPFLTAVVNFDDYPAGSSSAPIQSPCTVYCGQGMTIVSWNWGTQSNQSVAGIAASASFTLEPSSTSVGAVTSAEVLVKDAAGNPVVNDAVTISVSSGGVLDPTSNVVETTSVSGVATFTNLELDTAGNFTLTASVSGTTVTATSTHFTVAKGANSIVVTSTAPTQAYEGGPTYTPTASATSRDIVAITSATTGVCTISSGIVSFVGTGTCTLDFNDVGNANYVAATQQTQSFAVKLHTSVITVTSTAPANATVGGATYTPMATATSGDTVTITVDSSATSVCAIASGKVSYTAVGTCTLDFNDAGNATYAAASQKQQSFSVGKGANTITVTSTAPANATVGGATYTPMATTTSGDTVTITVDSSATSECSISSGVVSFSAAGTCTLDFNDPGNTNFVAANQIQQAFTVHPPNPYGVNITTVSDGLGKPGSGDQIVFTYSQTMMASSIKALWSGSSIAVDVQLTRNAGSSTVLAVCTATCGTAVNLGVVSLGDPGGATGRYVTSGSTAYLNATMTMATVGGESVVTVILGTVVSGTVTALTPTSTSTTLTWTPSASAIDTSGQACATTVVTESPAPVENF